MGNSRIAITTLPITADLIGRLDVDRWVYYCVDDFSVWPGLDGQVLEDMERQLVERVDHIVAASETLRRRLERLGRSSDLLTHGIDLEHWSVQPPVPSETEPHRDENRTHPTPSWWKSLTGPIILFWGLIDQRLDPSWCDALTKRMADTGLDHNGAGGMLVLVGPTQSPSPVLRTLSRVVMPGTVAYEELPPLAAMADVLVMPYADLPVTRAMQPLKFKEYLATGKPVVVRDLPATRPWADAADVVNGIEPFVERVAQRVKEGLPQQQAHARRRLIEESWSNKASQFEVMILGRTRVTS